MIYVGLKGHRNVYDTRELTKVFVDKVKILTDGEDPKNMPDYIESRLKINKSDEFAVVEGFIAGKKKRGIRRVNEASRNLPEPLREEMLDKNRRDALRSALFEVLSTLTGKKPPWGVLTGIRPVKIVQNFIDGGKTEFEIYKELTENKYLAKEKAQLLIGIAGKERQLIYPLDEKGLNFYVSIPFCPSRCRYCSFPSNDLHRQEEEVDRYLFALKKELNTTIDRINEKGLKVNTIYIGGGTPSVLSAEQFESLFATLKKLKGYENLKEITVEAGRPDTFSLPMLKALKENGVQRISLNPQTMNQETLILIGRNHTPEEIYKAYEMVGQVGFSSVNMDLIVGLPGETIKSLEKTLKDINKMQPENLTVHTLAIKTSSYFKRNEHLITQSEEEVLKMLDYVREFTLRESYEAYYMYRQKNMLGNFENVGYSKTGYESLYNMKIMAEKETILGFGAGAVTKIVESKGLRIHRRPNVKGLGHYLQRVDEVILEKQKILNEFF